MVLPVNGTREALFAFVQAVVDQSAAPVVAMPNPFYQIYEGAALLAGAEPHFLNTVPATAYTPELGAVDQSVWRRCQVLFLCSPGNPSGAVLSLQLLRQAVRLAERYDLRHCGRRVLHRDLYRRSIAAAWTASGRACRRSHQLRALCCVPQSSKRSSVPGLRSGFVAGDRRSCRAFCCIAPTMAARWRSRRNSQVSPLGMTTRMPPRIAACIRKSSTR